MTRYKIKSQKAMALGKRKGNTKKRTEGNMRVFQNLIRTVSRLFRKKREKKFYYGADL